MDYIENLRREIAQREAELQDLRARLVKAEAEKSTAESDKDRSLNGEAWKWPLEEHEYERYSRQMIVPNFGLKGQLNIKNAKVLLVGAGGLGCPAAAYLAGAGVGTLGLVDGDAVEVSNLHRQVAHSTARVGMMKVDSAVAYLKGLNPTITYHAHATHLTPQNAEEIVSQYDVVLDCTDHPTSRYLISDICVLLSKPLISASAFQTSGQLIVLNNPPGRGPCYRCVFPKPPPPESVVGCGEGGIVGPVVGVMGVLQALEAIKLLVRGDHHHRLKSVDGTEEEEDGQKQVGMLLFSGMGDVPFRTVRMRGKRKGCFACAGDDSALTLAELKNSMDYVQFCGVNEPVKLLRPEERISVAEYERISREKRAHVLLDVREKEHFELCSIPGSVNVPISRFTARREGMGLDGLIPGGELLPPDAPIYVVCRVGNDSQIAAKKLKDWGVDRDGERFVGDVLGGLRAWKDGVDPSLPFI
ncbi:Adenylyltransferase and sulfurtransferase uba4 [Trichoderma ghanense]|uniref:Adenylyltransferase and sulfurtransferase uba4 n=1 Tax=Trichoderma ghanense TaxID=65468 RepID=A0ABY2GWI5_9HYPO